MRPFLSPLSLFSASVIGLSTVSALFLCDDAFRVLIPPQVSHLFLHLVPSSHRWTWTLWSSCFYWPADPRAPSLPSLWQHEPFGPVSASPSSPYRSGSGRIRHPARALATRCPWATLPWAPLTRCRAPWRRATRRARGAAAPATGSRSRDRGPASCGRGVRRPPLQPRLTSRRCRAIN